MNYCPEMTVLGFVLSAEATQVLMVHRIARLDDEQLGKWNGLGGKMNPDEDPLTAMKRELFEEACIRVPDDGMRLRGTVSWPGFHRDGSDVFGFVFVVDRWIGQIPDANEEGSLVWQPIESLSVLPMWEGDRHFIPHVFDPDVASFHLVIPYADGRPTGCTGTVIGAKTAQ